MPFGKLPVSSHREIQVVKMYPLHLLLSGYFMSGGKALIKSTCFNHGLGIDEESTGRRQLVVALVVAGASPPACPFVLTVGAEELPKSTGRV